MREAITLDRDELEHLMKGGRLTTPNGSIIVLSDRVFNHIKDLAEKVESTRSRVNQPMSVREVSENFFGN